MKTENLIHRKFLTIIALLGLFVVNAIAGAQTDFKGFPSFKVTEGGTGRTPINLLPKEAEEFRCVISKIDQKYYWATRDNKEVVKIVGGAFITYFAIDGSGYVRVLIPEFKKVASIMSDSESKFDYVEHLLIGLRSITYYGTKLIE